MNDSFDSRALRLTDCYGQRFMKPGSYGYNISPVPGHLVTEERHWRIEVVERTTESTMHQHMVVVKTEGAKFRAEPPELVIEAGDLVLWNCPEPDAAPYVVMGDHEFFSSHRLVNESGYSHAFGSAGDYDWADAYGSDVAGVVRVRDPGCKDRADLQRWRTSLTKGTLVMISEGRAEPRDVDIIAGQTVFFAVVKAPGISITDRRLLSGRYEQEDSRARAGASTAREGAS